MYFLPGLSPYPAFCPVQAEAQGDAIQAISPREGGFSYPGPLTELGADRPHLKADVAGESSRCAQHGQVSAVKLAPLQMLPKPDRGFCSSRPATLQLPLILASSLLLCT